MDDLTLTEISQQTGIATVTLRKHLLGHHKPYLTGYKRANTWFVAKDVLAAFLTVYLDPVRLEKSTGPKPGKGNS